jgi:hypothetical protein
VQHQKLDGVSADTTAKTVKESTLWVYVEGGGFLRVEGAASFEVGACFAEGDALLLHQANEVAVGSDLADKVVAKAHEYYRVEQNKTSRGCERNGLVFVIR